MNQTQATFHILDTCIPLYCPEQTDALLQLKRLLLAEKQPVIAAIGDYNVGKSSLLNTLIGKDVFAVSDRRETRQLACHQADDICWIDTPGLDADLAATDDRQAYDALQKADLLLFLHNICNGELSPKQLTRLQQLRQTAHGAELKLVLTRIDECPATDREVIANRIRVQTVELPILQVSSQRYRTGLSQQQPQLIALSGIPALKNQLVQWCSRLSGRREQQQRALIGRLGKALQQQHVDAQMTLNQIESHQQERSRAFTMELQPLLHRLARCGT